MNAITSYYADLCQKESGWTDTPKKTLHIWLIGPILCLGKILGYRTPELLFEQELDCIYTVEILSTQIVA